MKNKNKNQKTLLPEISIIVCIYNHEKWIERCIRSLFNQINIQRKLFEIILIDDKSKDNSLKVINNYKDFQRS